MDQKLFAFLVALTGMNPAAAQGIRITEIMSDPEPVIGMPPTEYIEIHNSGERAVSLHHWSLEDASGRRGEIDSAVLMPGAWRVLCPSGESHYFSPWSAIGVDPWPVLNNDSDVIILRDMDGEIIDSIGYRRSWHRPEAREGGVALERFNIYGRCDPQRHWGSSEDISGGTPGALNSLWIDPASDTVEAQIYASRYIHVWFSRELDPQTLPYAQIRIDPGTNIRNLDFRKDRLVIDTWPPPDHRQEYTMELSGFITCGGRQVHLKGIHFTPSRPANEGDIKISEVMFNSGPDFNDYLELINVSEDLLDMNGLKLSYFRDGERTDTLAMDTLLSLFPGEFIALTENKKNLLAAFSSDEDRILELREMINFPSDRASISIHSPDGNLIEQVNYHYTFHHEVIDNKQGVSLERTSLINHGKNRWDWASASAAVGYGTPGRRNSQREDSGTGPFVDFSPELIDEGDELGITYSGLPSNSILTIRIFNLEGFLLKNVVESYPCGSEGTYRFLPDTKRAGHGPLLIWVEILSDGGFIFRKTGRVYIR